MDSIFLLPLATVFSIFPIWLIEQFLPYPWLVEEPAKLLLLVIFAKRVPLNAFRWVFLSGLAFGFSEAIFYQVAALQTLSLPDLLFRLIFTIPMHTMTFLCMFMGMRRGKLTTILTVAISIGVHYFFNVL